MIVNTLLLGLVIVAGGPDDETIWRGWPVHVRVTPPAEVRVTGPTKVALQPGKDGWVISPATSAQMQLGRYEFTAGTDTCAVTVAAAPAQLTPAQANRRREIELWVATELGDHAAARRVAEEWTTAEPKSVTAHAALGEALYAAGDVGGAFKAYQQAIRLYPAGREAPRYLHRRSGELFNEMVAKVPGRPVTPEAEPIPVAPVAAAPAKPDLAEAAILADRAGQWAIAAEAGSQYGSGAPYSPQQATGAPNVPQADDHGNAWCPAKRTGGTEWLELTFERAVVPTAVRVRQNFGAVGLIKIEGIDAAGQKQVLWEGRDPHATTHTREIRWFSVGAPAGGGPIIKLRLTVDLDSHPAWKQIDAVQLVGVPAS